MGLDRRQLLGGGAAAGALISLSGPARAAGADEAVLSRLSALSDTLLVTTPESATALGLDTGARAGLKAKLSDRSWSAVQSLTQLCKDEVKALKAIPDAGLSHDVRIHRDVAIYAMNLGIEAEPFAFGDNTVLSAMSESSTPYVVSQQSGLFASAAEFLDSQHQIATSADAEAYLDRLHCVAREMDAETDRVRRDAASGVVAPDFILANALGQMNGLLQIPGSQSRFVQSLARRAREKKLDGDWGGRATVIVLSEIYPALTRQRDVLKALAAKAGSDAGAWRFKDGEAYYSWCLKQGTSTNLTAEEIHQVGLDQNRAIEARMDGLLKAQGLTQGTVGERMIALGKDPRYLFPNTEAGRAAVIAELNRLIAGVRGRMASQFTLKLKAPVLAKPVPVEIQDGAGQGYMNTGSLDGSRPSTYYINLKDTANWPKFSLPSLTYHETIPGHAWQGAYVTETGQLPLIRILFSGFNAYVEGWALYAEQLGDEMGMYADDWAGQLGYLQAQKFRAVRLVVDTGLHAKRWTRQQAIDWAVANSGRTVGAMTSEIDRYISWPGQACGYKIGHNEINRLRDRARAALGSRFDIRTFNDTVVRTSAVPLSVLSSEIDAYIARGGVG